MDKKQRKNLKNEHCLLSHCPPDRASVLSTECGGCHPKEPIVASSHKIKHIIIIIKILTLICQSQFSFLLGKKKNQLKLYFFPLVLPNF